jgi:hypothetical protein
VESCGLALGVAVKGGKQVGFDFAGQCLGAVFGGSDFGPELGGACLDGGRNGLDGAVEVLFCGGPVVLGGCGVALLAPSCAGVCGGRLRITIRNERRLPPCVC